MTGLAALGLGRHTRPALYAAALLGGLLLGAACVWLWLDARARAEAPPSVGRVAGHPLDKRDFAALVTAASHQLGVPADQVPREERRRVLDTLVGEALVAEHAIGRGMARDDYIHWRVAQEYVNNTVNGQIDPRSYSEADRRAYYDAHPDEFRRKREWHLRQIFIDSPRGDPPEFADAAEARARSIAEQLRANPDAFDALYAQYNQGPAEVKDGWVGWVPEDVQIVAIREALADLEAGQVKVVRTSYGWHVLTCAGRRGGEVMPFAEARKKALFRIVTRRHEELRGQLLSELKQKWGVEPVRELGGER